MHAQGTSTSETRILFFIVGRGPVPRQALGHANTRGGQAPALRLVREARGGQLSVVRARLHPGKTGQDLAILTYRGDEG